jgi:hypothetical protein
MKNHQLIFFAILIIFLSYSFSQNKIKEKHKLLQHPKFHQFLEEPDTEENDEGEEEINELEEEENEAEEEEEGKKKKNEEEENEDIPKVEEEEISINNKSDNSKINIKYLWVNKYNVYSLQKIQKKIEKKLMMEK